MASFESEEGGERVEVEDGGAESGGGTQKPGSFVVLVVGK